jgi:hypothetical protein
MKNFHKLKLSDLPNKIQTQIYKQKLFIQKLFFPNGIKIKET